MVSFINDYGIRDTYNFISNSPRATSESCIRSAPGSGNVEWGSGTILGNMREKSTEEGGSVIQGFLSSSIVQG